MNRSLNLSNTLARHAAIYSSGLQAAKAPACSLDVLHELITYLGYVQQDPIQVVTRAHDHILWSRNQHYRPKKLYDLLEKRRSIFEHFAHDACVLPIETLPYWTHQFERKAKVFKDNPTRNNLLTKSQQRQLLARIADEGPLCSRDFKPAGKTKKLGVWGKPAHKQTLDYLWFVGELAVAKRDKFTKYYDLAERIYPKKYTDAQISIEERMTWFCRHAFARLGFATPKELMHFWEVSSLTETKQWCEEHAAKLKAINVETANGEQIKSLTLKKNLKLISAVPPPSPRLKILNPFDPLIRDRKRLTYLFGFDYRIEMYVPPAKRQYGYYVYPLLEFDKFVGRLQVRHDREQNVIKVDNLWPENKIAFGKQRMQKLHSELERLKRFCGADSVLWA